MTAPTKVRKTKKVAVQEQEQELIPPQKLGPQMSPTVETVAELATLFEGVFNQLVDSLRSVGHFDPAAGAKEILNSGYNVAQVSISAANASKPEPKPRLTGFNR